MYDRPSRGGRGGGGGGGGPRIAVSDKGERWANWIDTRKSSPDERNESIKRRQEQALVEDEILGNMFGNSVSPGINFDLYEAVPVEVTGNNAPEAIANFSDIDLGDSLSYNIKLARYTKPTPVQKGAIPAIMKRIITTHTRSSILTCM